MATWLSALKVVLLLDGEALAWWLCAEGAPTKSVCDPIKIIGTKSTIFWRQMVRRLGFVQE
uniref:Uncharacterized protein n=1 Tax=Oryza brachyantha TaxID=4533 RepID=J3N072_ORYBR